MGGPHDTAARRALLDELRALMHQGIEPTALGLYPNHADLLDRLIAAFGGLTMARFELDRRARPGDAYSPGAAIAAMKQLHAFEPRLTEARLRQLGEEQLVKALDAEFGGVARARKALDLDAASPPRAPRRRSGYDVERVVEEMTDRLAAGLAIDRRALMAEGRLELIAAILTHVGGFAEARKRALSMLRFRSSIGVTPPRPPGRKPRRPPLVPVTPTAPPSPSHPPPPRAPPAARASRSTPPGEKLPKPAPRGLEWFQPIAKRPRRTATPRPAPQPVVDGDPGEPVDPPRRRRRSAPPIDRTTLSPIEVGERWPAFAAEVAAVAANEHAALPSQLVSLPLEAMDARRDELVRSLAAPLITLLTRKWELLELSPPSPVHDELVRLVTLLAKRGVALPEPLVALAATDAPRGRVRRLRTPPEF